MEQPEDTQAEEDGLDSARGFMRRMNKKLHGTELPVLTDRPLEPEDKSRMAKLKEEWGNHLRKTSY